MVLDGLKNAVSKFLRGTGSYEKNVNEFVKEMQRELIKSDVNVKLVLELSKKIKERALKEAPPPGASRRDWFIKIVYEELAGFFGGDVEPQVKPPRTPWVIMLIGVQGSGKTTTAGKLAYYYRHRGYKVGLVAADTHRPGAYDQLKQLADQVGALFYGEPGEKDAVSIAKRGVEALREKGADIIIVDTAGRHGYGDEQGLLDEMEMISRKINPDEVILVIDAAIGQKAFDLARRFHERTPIGSIIVTKLDGTARGGGALSAVVATGAGIKFIGTGEKISEIEPFRPKRFVGRILGMGDIESLLEKLQTLEEAEELEKRTQEMMEGKINMRLIYHQLKGMRKMGPLSKVLQMLPGLGLFRLDAVDTKLGEEKIDRWLAIIESMTYRELDKPEIIDKSRMRRLAFGSGTSLEDVRELLAYYNNLKKMLKQLKRKKRLLRKLGGAELGA
ncbi:MAG: signal recognition particle protein Srp54 [Desulfurococcales archaeon]|nr:signal recognition particle protein Srp54 [Desulfurococcales archaeon]